MNRVSHSLVIIHKAMQIFLRRIKIKIGREYQLNKCVPYIILKISTVVAT